MYPVLATKFIIIIIIIIIILFAQKKQYGMSIRQTVQ